MVRNVVVACMALAVFGVLTGGVAAAADHKGVGLHQAAAPSISYTTSCKDVCVDKCKDVQREVCVDVSVPYKYCKDVAVDSTEQQCRKVCTNMPDEVPPAPVPEAVNYKTILLNLGKGLSGGKGVSVDEGVSTGKGRRMLGGKGFGVSVGKGWNALENILNCKIQCRDVPATSYVNQCEVQYRTEQNCKTVTEQSCNPVCKQVCEQVPVVVHTPMTYSKGKGKGKSVVIGKGH